MKRILLMAVLVTLVSGLWAQGNYKYVIIPTTIPEIGKGINPYGVSAAIQKNLTLKSIPCMFETPERPDDYCDALIVTVEKVNSLLRNKLLLHFKDCTNREVLSAEGTGMSKDFREGYAEAIEEALKDVKELPAIQYARTSQVAPVKQVVEKTEPEAVAVKEEPVASAEVAVNVEEKEAPYQPKNMYFNEKYLVDFIVKDGGGGSLLILNGKDLGYEKLQKVADIKASDIPGVYAVQWTQPDGSIWSGVAQQTDFELKISVSSGDQKEVITLRKQ